MAIGTEAMQKQSFGACVHSIIKAVPARILFGSGALAQLPAELDLLGRSRILVVSTAQQAEDAERITAEIKSHSIGAFTDAELQTPVTVTQKALSVIKDSDADGVVAVGGGSAIGLGKAIVLRSGLPLIALPTTYAGSEVTPMLSETDKGAKLVRRDPQFCSGSGDLRCRPNAGDVYESDRRQRIQRAGPRRRGALCARRQSRR